MAEVPECTVPGGHCWESAGFTLACYPPANIDQCKHCGARSYIVRSAPKRVRYG